MKKNVIKIIVGISTITLVAIILVVINNSYAPKKEPTKDETLYKDSKIKKLNLKGISTKDKKISIDDTIVYFTPDNGISQIDLEIKSKDTLENLYLLIEFELDNKVEKKIIYHPIRTALYHHDSSCTLLRCEKILYHRRTRCQYHLRPQTR